MDNLSEALVGRFLTRNGLAFVCWQYELKREYGGKAEFDFVVLDFEQRRIVLVEVSDSAEGLGSVRYKANESERVYLDGLARQVAAQTNHVTAEWETVFLGFVRKVCLAAAWREFADKPRIYFRSIEEAAFDYWDLRGDGLLPDRPGEAI